MKGVDMDRTSVQFQIGLAIRTLRKQHKWSLKDLRQETLKHSDRGISVNQLSRIERLESSPTLDTIQLLAKTFNIPVMDLFTPDSISAKPSNTDFEQTRIAKQPERLGHVVQRLMKVRHWTLRDLSKSTGISVMQLSRIISLTSQTTEQNIWKLAQVFQVPVETMFGEEASTDKSTIDASSNFKGHADPKNLTITISIDGAGLHEILARLIPAETQ